MSSTQDFDHESPEESFDSEESKRLLKDALVWFERLLTVNNLIASQPSATISRNAKLIGEEIYTRTLEMLSEKKLVTEEELYEEDNDVVPVRETLVWRTRWMFMNQSLHCIGWRTTSLWIAKYV